MRRNRWFSVLSAIVFAVVVFAAASFVANQVFDTSVARTLSTAIPIAFAVGVVEFISRRNGKRGTTDTEDPR